LFSQGSRYVIYFDESLKGLRRGAPLTFRGVDIGQVTEIRAVYDPASHDVTVPVTVEIRPRAVALGDDGVTSSDAMAGLIERGLRARLDLQSLLTGQLLIALDFFPPRPGAPATPLQAGVIPSVPSTLAALQRTADEALMELPEITRSLREVSGSLRGFLSDRNRESLQETLTSVAALGKALGDPEGPTQKTLADLPALVSEMRSTAGQLSTVLQKLDQLAATGDERLRALGEQTTKLSQSIGRAADQAGSLIRENRQGLNEFVDEGLPEIQGFVDDATRLVNELSSTIRDMRQDPARFFLGDRAGQGVQLP
jgi:paraquat-inducible protein B